MALDVPEREIDAVAVFVSLTEAVAEAVRDTVLVGLVDSLTDADEDADREMVALWEMESVWLADWESDTVSEADRDVVPESLMDTLDDSLAVSDCELDTVSLSEAECATAVLLSLMEADLLCDLDLDVSRVSESVGVYFDLDFDFGPVLVVLMLEILPVASSDRLCDPEIDLDFIS